jgi:phosphopantothenoylcysteine decarboxylase/phosphopantothenate--cysteine ligase
MLRTKNILLIISGGIAAYKSLELIRLLRKDGAGMRCILTGGGEKFVTPLSVSALSENPVYTDLWSLKDESEMGHIRLSREADLIVIAPASANMLAKMAQGLAGDLASATLLAANKPILAAPAMNQMMWGNPATQANVKTLRERGINFIGPDSGDMACGETGAGRMSEPEAIFAAIVAHFGAAQPLKGKRALVTSGPTYEPLDPVRFLGNRSSGKQGHAVAIALRDAGAEVTLISGPVALPDPKGMKVVHVETARQMFDACLAVLNQSILPADIAVCSAAVSDWTPAQVSASKMKKGADRNPPEINLRENPDILGAISKAGPQRPALVVGFAAETGDLIEEAKGKRARKGCDWVVANDVSGNKVFGSDRNEVHVVSASGVEAWPEAGKDEVARRLVERIAAFFENPLSQAAE